MWLSQQMSFMCELSAHLNAHTQDFLFSPCLPYSSDQSTVGLKCWGDFYFPPLLSFPLPFSTFLFHLFPSIPTPDP